MLNQDFFRFSATSANSREEFAGIRKKSSLKSGAGAVRAAKVSLDFCGKKVSFSRHSSFRQSQRPEASAIKHPPPPPAFHVNVFNLYRQCFLSLFYYDSDGPEALRV
jgi:hypothetical protein